MAEPATAPVFHEVDGLTQTTMFPEVMAQLRWMRDELRDVRRRIDALEPIEDGPPSA